MKRTLRTVFGIVLLILFGIYAYFAITGGPTAATSGTGAPDAGQVSVSAAAPSPVAVEAAPVTAEAAPAAADSAPVAAAVLPEPAPTPEPTPEPTPDMSPLPDSYFDDAAFVGDSVSGVLEYYAYNDNGLGDALFLAQTNYSVHAAADGELNPRYRGTAMRVEDIVREAGIKKVFIMLGLNDRITEEDVGTTMNNWRRLITNIQTENPDTRIFIQSCTPVYGPGQNGVKNNQLMDAYNRRLYELCEEMGCTYVKIGEHFKDADGNLMAEYCRDRYVHLNINGGRVWGELLKDPANYSNPPR